MVCPLSPERLAKYAEIRPVSGSVAPIFSGKRSILRIAGRHPTQHNAPTCGGACGSSSLSSHPVARVAQQARCLLRGGLTITATGLHLLVDDSFQDTSYGLRRCFLCLLLADFIAVCGWFFRNHISKTEPSAVIHLNGSSISIKVRLTARIIFRIFLPPQASIRCIISFYDLKSH